MPWVAPWAVMLAGLMEVTTVYLLAALLVVPWAVMLAVPTVVQWVVQWADLTEATTAEK